MKSSRFWTGLILISILTLIMIFSVHSLESMRPYQNFSFYGMGLMLLFTILMDHFSKRAIKSKSKNAFIQLVMISVFVKMVLTITLVALYVRFVNPENKFFILPFIAIYIIYTIFETLHSYKIALTNTAKENE